MQQRPTQRKRLAATEIVTRRPCHGRSQSDRWYRLCTRREAVPQSGHTAYGERGAVWMITPSAVVSTWSTFNECGTKDSERKDTWTSTMDVSPGLFQIRRRSTSAAARKVRESQNSSGVRQIPANGPKTRSRPMCWTASSGRSRPTASGSQTSPTSGPAKPRGSSHRPPPGQGAATLQNSNLLVQQVTFDHDLAEFGLQPLGLQRLAALRPGRQRGLPAVKKASRHVVRVAAVTPSERETVFRSSPRISRSTASGLRCGDIRPPRPSPTQSVSSIVIFRPSRRYRPLRDVSSNCGAGDWTPLSVLQLFVGRHSI